jgi:hypothetical protein
MSINTEVEGIEAQPLPQPASDQAIEAGNGHVAETAQVEVAAPAKPADRRRRPAWVASVSVGAAGLLAAGTLGYLLYSTAQQRDGLHTRLVSTTTTLGQTQQQLNVAQADARTKKVTADYVALYIADEGKILTDYHNVASCGSYSACRTNAQQLLTDMQAFQADRKSANVPSSLESSDSSLGDALSAAIAGDQELISGMDDADLSKITDGGNKVDAAMLNLAKAEAAMGTQLK